MNTPQRPRVSAEDHQARALRAISKHFETVAQKAPVDVFVMGPHVGTNAAAASPAMNLRQSLITRLREEGYPVPADLAEVIERVKSQFGQEVDLTTTEQLFAQTVDLLVFIPSSNGSAAEIGYFAGVDLNPDEDIARRSLVLLDVAHEATPGFVALGPAALLKSQGARVWWVDYGDVGRVWDVVWGEVQAARLRKARRDVVRPKA